MKKFLGLFIMTLFMVMITTNISHAANEKKVTSVAVSGIDAPYSKEQVLDTKGEVDLDARYRITEISWKTPSEATSGYYEVSIALKASKGYIFSGDVTATVNGDSANSQIMEEKDELIVTYAFDNNSSTSGTINNATSVKVYRITVYSNTEKGHITPKVVRVSKGKNQTFKIIPNEGYKIKNVVVDGESIGAVSEYTFRKVKEDHSISAQFEKIEEQKPFLKIIINVLNQLFNQI